MSVDLRGFTRALYYALTGAISNRRAPIMNLRVRSSHRLRVLWMGVAK